VIIALEARVAQDRVSHVVKLSLCRSIPQNTQRCVVVLQHDGMDRRDANLQIRSKPRVELHESNKLGNITNDLGSPPMIQEVVFALGGAVAISTHVNANKLNTLWLWEDE